MKQINDGIPQIEAYENLIKSDLFLEMETFSNAFLIRNKHYLEDYSNKWVSDPLHQWSRQWEYPFTYAKVASYISTYAADPINILDAGSGVTFFPYFLKSYFQQSVIYCCDCDAGLENTYSLINRNQDQPIPFSVSFLENMKYQNAFFDCIYCISVLEHAENYQKIIDEFHRIMKPNGLLIITFDISIDGNNDVSPAAAERLLMDFEKKYLITDNRIDDIKTLIRTPNILTTGYAEKLNHALIPWKKPPSFTRQIKSLIKRGKFIEFPPPYTVYCQSMTKI